MRPCMQSLCRIALFVTRVITSPSDFAHRSQTNEVEYFQGARLPVSVSARVSASFRAIEQRTIR